MSTGDDVAAGDTLSRAARNRIVEHLFRSEASGLARYIRRRIGRPDEVQDLVQEVFARLAAASSSILADRPQAYMQRIARNLVIDRFRRNAIRQRARHVPVEEALCVSTAPQQEWAIEAADVEQRYRAVLETLPLKTRRLFLLNRLEKKSYADLAKAEGISVKAVEYHISRALTQLHRAFYGE